MGSGKTLLATIMAYVYYKSNPNNKIYANYSLKLPNFVYTPNLILPFSELRDCLLIVDDIYACQNIKGLVQVIVNLSRKNNVEVVLTAQRDIMIDKTLRILASKILKPILSEDKSKMIIYEEIEPEKFAYRYYIMNPIQIIQGIYDTNEKVKVVNELDIEESLSKLSREDILTNIQFLYKNKKDRERMLKKLGFFEKK